MPTKGSQLGTQILFVNVLDASIKGANSDGLVGKLKVDVLSIINKSKISPLIG